MTEDLSDLYQELILDHSKRPHNFRKPANVNRQAEGNNPLCGDHYTIYLRMEGDKIADVGFDGAGCAISKASASLLTETVKGKSKAEVKRLFDQVHDMVTTGNVAGNTVAAGSDRGASLGKLVALTGVHKFPARVKCAILSWHTLVAALESDGKVVTTEDEI